MELEQAIERARNNEDVKKLTDYFLCSCHACITDIKKDIAEWTLFFYNPKKKLMIDCFVNDKFVTVGEETPPISAIEKPDFNELKINVNDALQTARKNFKKNTASIIITLHQKDNFLWTISIIAPDMTATIFDIDAKTGEIIKEKETSLIRKM
ncbi:MAG TPA: PepSY domain-containing protein [Candidatus Aenigmarchaeota archaeon]|nr:PepSY domain-containing protein [Candidatus Aenigmarchaeota archaeon]